MEAKELMINDWVMAKSPQQIKELGTTFCTNKNDDLLFTEKIEPLPLTKEVFEANGFNVGDYTVWKYNCECYLLVANPEIGKICIYETHGHFTSGFETKSLQTDSFRYVHEFQHALRLLGLVELADNFNPPHP